MLWDRGGGSIVSPAGASPSLRHVFAGGPRRLSDPTQKGDRMPLTEAVLTGPGAGMSRTYGLGSATELKLCGEQSGGAWAVVEYRVRVGEEPPIHTHTREDESVYVLDG